MAIKVCKWRACVSYGQCRTGLQPTADRGLPEPDEKFRTVGCWARSLSALRNSLQPAW